MRREFDAKLRKVGNSYVLTVPSAIIERFKFKEGKYFTVRIDDEE